MSHVPDDGTQSRKDLTLEAIDHGHSIARRFERCYRYPEIDFRAEWALHVTQTIGRYDATRSSLRYWPCRSRWTISNAKAEIPSQSPGNRADSPFNEHNEATKRHS